VEVDRSSHYFKKQKQPTWVLVFRVVAPAKYQGVLLEYFAPIRKWKRSKGHPPGSNLGRVAAVVTDRRWNRKVKESMFEGKLFRCSIRPTRGAVPYSVRKGVIEQLTG